MKAMILAAGLGTRLRPLTEHVPKPLLPVGGTPLIVWNLFLLRHHGIKDVVINLHYLGHLIQETLGDGSQWGMRLSYLHEPVILGTGGGIKGGESFFAGEDFIVLNADTLIELNLSDVVKLHRATGACATMVLRADHDVERWGVVETSHDGQVLTINGRGWSEAPKPNVKNYMFAGVHVMNPQLLRHCPAEEHSSIIDAYLAELEKGSVVMGYIASGYWSDVGTPERYTQAQRDVDGGSLSLYSIEGRGNGS